VDYGPFSLYVIHKESLCPSGGVINRLMMIHQPIRLMMIHQPITVRVSSSSSSSTDDDDNDETLCLTTISP
jgi:hypothetical protein